MAAPSLVERLAAAYGGRDVVTPRPGELPDTIEGAEALQDAWMPLLGATGGYKLGATIPAVREALNLPRAFFAPIPRARIFPDGASVPEFVARQTGVECEYGFRLGRDLPAGTDPLDEGTVRAAFDAVLPAIEIPGTRFSRLAEYAGVGIVADAGALGSLVLGAPIEGIDVESLGDAPVTLSVDGETVVTGSGAVMDGGAFGPIHAFVNRARARGLSLRAGEVVVTGSCTGYQVVERGREIAASFAALSAGVTMRFAPA
ncbi:2-keto-4-pentenoate hydratase [Methylobacterium sp. sgz302541]|uniref:2-keto-4-pentenoate hydratase n=1 Tax=unclassified Methylobacterium TaxID=2615210 RepID=UPI003D34610D